MLALLLHFVAAMILACSVMPRLLGYDLTLVAGLNP